MHVEVNAEKCVASGQCVLIAPEVFDQQDDDGMVILLDDSPAPENHDAVHEAALVCPAAAITLTDSGAYIGSTPNATNLAVVGL